MASVTPLFDQRDLSKEIKDALDKAVQKYIAGLIGIGRAFIADAKTTGKYTNRSGNLSSSIGFIVAKGSEVVAQEFEVILKGKVGKDKGIAMAKSVLSKIPKGHIALIVVAGMDYARILESKGRNVLTGSSLTAIEDLKALLKNVA